MSFLTSLAVTGCGRVGFELLTLEGEQEPATGPRDADPTADATIDARRRDAGSPSAPADAGAAWRDATRWEAASPTDARAPTVVDAKTPSDAAPVADATPMPDSSRPLPDATPMPDSSRPLPDATPIADATPAPDVVLTDATATCTPEVLDGSAYLFCLPVANYAGAVAACQSVGMALARVDGDAENALILDAAQRLGAFGSVGIVYVGGHQGSGAWTWPDGTEFWAGGPVSGRYENWDDNQPQSTRDCMGLLSTGFWQARSCNTVTGFVCE